MSVCLPGTRTLYHVCIISKYQMIIKASNMLDNKTNQVDEANLQQIYQFITTINVM
jgi:hypothetical protein